MFAIALIPIVLGLVVAWGGLLGWREKLSDRGAGVRTDATLRSADAFRLGNKVAGLPTIVAGFIGVFAGVAGLVLPTTAGIITVTVIGLAGMFALVVAGGVLGHRAALAVPEPAPSGCDGCACGTCVLQKA
ncbi:SdpI family protein [Amycolatopsis sp. GM8]|uniref:SdpI family protein n=1 Tax=Amycolatopsis sp. GM8 TaxID=2896530 RepID=UPI001F1CA94B|nr:SdpI family protein [Amycolatopsis sp. GM8]